MFYDVPNGWPNNTGCFNMGTWNLTDSHIQIPEYVMLWNTWTLNSSCYPESRIRSWAHGPDLLCWWNTWVAAAVAASNQTSQYGPGQLLQYRNHPILRGQFIYRHLPAIYDYLIITMVYSINIYIYTYTQKCSNAPNSERIPELKPEPNELSSFWGCCCESPVQNGEDVNYLVWVWSVVSILEVHHNSGCTGDFCLGLRLGLVGWF